MTKPTDLTLWAESLFGAESREGLVRLQMKTEEVTCSPDDARRWALDILRVAEAAEMDEIIMSFFTGPMEMTEEATVPILRAFREQRDQIYAEKEKANRQ